MNNAINMPGPEENGKRGGKGYYKSLLAKKKGEVEHCLITGCRKVFEYQMDIYIEKMAEDLSVRDFEGFTACRKSLVAHIAAPALKIG